MKQSDFPRSLCFQTIRRDYALYAKVFGSGLDPDSIRSVDPYSGSESGSGSKRAKTTQKIEKLRNFMFWSAGCSFLRAEAFFCSLDVLYGGLGKTSDADPGSAFYFILKTLLHKPKTHEAYWISKKMSKSLDPTVQRTGEAERRGRQRTSNW